MPTIDFSDLNSVTNKAYRKYYDDYRRFQIFKGGAGAGKSFFIAQKIIYNILLRQGYNGLIIRNTGRDNHDSTFSELRKCIFSFGMQNLFDINRSRGAEEITCILNQNKLVFRGLDDVEKVKSVTFATGDLTFIWIEEASETREDDVNQLNLRLRGIGGIPKHMVLSFNPIDAGHWIKARFFDAPLDPAEGFICESTYHDNEYLDQPYRDELERLRLIDDYCYRVYALNEWGSKTGAAVFRNLKIYDFNVREHDYSPIRHGLDFGFHHANAYIRCGYRDGELYIWKEIYAKRQLNADFIASVEEMHGKSYRITGESAEPDKLAEFMNAGFLIDPARKGPDSLWRTVQYLRSLPCIHIHKTNCPNAAREFSRYKHREIKGGQILDKEFVEVEDDTIAATRYAVEDMVSAESIDKRHFFIRR